MQMIQVKRNVSQSSLVFFLMRKKAPPLHFYTQFMKQSKQCYFPIANGYPIVTDQCTKPECIKFIPKNQLSISIILQIYNKQNVKCQTEKCEGSYSSDTLLYQDDLEQLYNRNFTSQQKQRLKKVKITSDFQVLAQTDQKWKYFMAIANQKRDQNFDRINQLHRPKGQQDRQVYNRKSIQVNIQEIYKCVKQQFDKMKLNELSKELNQKQQKSNSLCNFIDICVLFQSQDNKLKIHRYFQKNQQCKITNYDLEIVQYSQQTKQTQNSLAVYADKFSFQIAYNKIKKEIYFVSRQGDLYYSNLTDRVQFLHQSIIVSKIAKIEYPKAFLNQINPNKTDYHQGYAFMYHQSYLYLIGGRYGQKQLNQVFRVRTPQQINKVSQSIQCEHFANLLKPNLIYSVAIREISIYVYGRDKQGQNFDLELISLQKGQQLNIAKKILEADYQHLKVQNPTLSVLQKGIIAISGAVKTQKSQRRDHTVWIVQQQNRQVLLKQVFPQIQQPKILKQVVSDSVQGNTVIIKKFENRKNQMILTKIIKKQGKWKITSEIRKFNN